MANPAQITTDMLFAEIGRLHMETLVRAAHEDALEQELAVFRTLSAPPEKPVKETPRG